MNEAVAKAATLYSIILMWSGQCTFKWLDTVVLRDSPYIGRNYYITVMQHFIHLFSPMHMV